MKTAPVTKATRQPGRISAQALRSTPASKRRRAILAIPILDTRLKVIDRKADIQGRLGGETLAQCKAANILMTTAFAYDVMEAPAKEIDRLVAMLSAIGGINEARVKMVDTHALNVPTAQALTELSKLLDERQAIMKALSLTAGNEGLITALAARSREIDDLIVSSPARTGHDLAAKINMAIDALSEGDGAESVLSILNSCRFNSYSFAAAVSS